jgi:hypothetical protein
VLVIIRTPAARTYGVLLGVYLGCWLVSILLGSLGSLLQPSLLQGLLVLGLILTQELWSVRFLSLEKHCILNVSVTNLWHRAWSLPENMFEGSWAHVSAMIILIDAWLCRLCRL